MSKKPVKIKFVQNSLPALEAGEYKLTVSQDLTIGSESPGVNQSTLNFAIWGERFRLQSDEVIKVYPPAHTTGEYGNVLPHVMLRRKTLPWERSIETGDQKSKNYPNGNVIPWLALLIIDQNDPPFNNPVVTAGASRLGKVSDLMPDPNNTTKTISYFSEARQQHSKVSVADLLDYGETADEKCQLIDIPIDLFNKIAPTADDMSWLAHNQISYFEDGSVDTEMAIVMANRLPRQGSMSTAHLVSLEGMEAYLPTADGPSQQLGDAAFIRLISLYSWTFNAVELPIHFSTYLENLNNGTRAGMPDSILKKPLKASNNPELERFLSSGLLPFEHLSRTGDQLISWYRGPASPVDPNLTISFSQDDPFHIPVRSADALTIFDSGTGMFDLSYSAAWQLGRLFALNSKKFSTGLYKWKKDLIARTIDLAIGAGVLPSRSIRSTFYKSLVSFLKDPKKLRELFPTDPVLPGFLSDWLADLLLLRNIPFHYLVPDESMLPMESLKFFRLDRNWLACAFDGAMSIGRSTEAQVTHDRVFMEGYFDQAMKKAGYKPGSKANTTGLLLRSAVVKGWWPGIQIDGYASAEIMPPDNTRVERIRFEVLSPEVLICLFNDAEQAVQRVNIHEPAQGTHFGISPMSKEGTIQKELRFVSGNFVQPGKSKPIPGEELFQGSSKEDQIPITTKPIVLGENGREALPISLFANEIGSALKTNQALDQLFTSAEFGLEMIEGVEEVGYRFGVQKGQ